MKQLFLVVAVLSFCAGPALASDSLIIAGDAAECDMSYVSQPNNSYNYGGVNSAYFGDGYNGEMDLRLVIKWPTLADTMAAYAPATWDSARLGLFVSDVSQLTAGSSVPDSLMTTLNKITTLWDEGVASGAATGGVTWDSASATGDPTDDPPNDPLDWTDGGQFSATEEPAGPDNDTVYLVGGEVAANDTLYWSISGTTLSDTLGDGLIVLYQRTAEGDDAGSTAYISVRTDGYTTAAQRPFLEIFYTTGAAATAGQVIIVN